ncbi:methyltransferase family protein [Herbaspirillum sp. CF444]|nr:methyltransferase family protein [Herbaspirillum sp. CF444]
MQAGAYRIFKCTGCGLEHTYPVPTLDELSAFYTGYTDIRAADDVVLRNAGRNIAALAAYGYTPQKSMLDFGTGDASFVTLAGQQCYGIDFKDSGVERVYRQLSDLPVNSFEFITLWGVLEHLNDPMATIKELTPMLEPGGKMIITTVDAEGPIPYYYKPVEHLTYWTHKAFNTLFEKCGLKLVEHRPYMMMQKSAIYLDRLLSRTPADYRTAFNPTLAGLPEYVEVPTNEIFVVAEKA